MGRDQVVGTEPRIQQISVQGAAMVLAADGSSAATDPALSATPCVLNDVAFVSSTEVLAVGQTGSGPVIQVWDGSEWRAVALQANSTRADLRGVSAVEGSGIAVGAILDRAARMEIPLILHREGSDWTVAAPPDLGAPYVLTGVIHVSPHEAWAVGHGLPPGAGIGGVVLHWDGSEWARAATPVTGSLMALAMTSPEDVWAAGEDGDRRPTLLHFDGVEWRESSLATTARRGLTGVAARSATDAWAVGPDSLFHWDGSDWSQTQADGLEGAATVAAGADVWIAGGAGRLARFDGARWQRRPARTDATWTGSASGEAGAVWLVGSQRLVRRPVP